MHFFDQWLTWCCISMQDLFGRVAGICSTERVARHFDKPDSASLIDIFKQESFCLRRSLISSRQIVSSLHPDPSDRGRTRKVPALPNPSIEPLRLVHIWLCFLLDFHTPPPPLYIQMYALTITNQKTTGPRQHEGSFLPSTLLDFGSFESINPTIRLSTIRTCQRNVNIYFISVKCLITSHFQITDSILHSPTPNLIRLKIHKRNMMHPNRLRPISQRINIILESLPFSRLHMRIYTLPSNRQHRSLPFHAIPL